MHGGILSLTDSHHYHHGQKPTMVGICHGGNMPVGLDPDDHDDDGIAPDWQKDYSSLQVGHLH